jgi:hypothetical protein
MKALKLGTTVKDTATGLKGMLTLLQLRQDFSQYYNFQPQGLNPEDGQPVDTYWIEPQRVVDGIAVDIDLPEEVMATEVRDTATGFHGKVISMTHFLSGCTHIEIQPEGRNKKTGNPFKSLGLDIMRCEGKAIKKLSVHEKEEHKKEKPSPMSYEHFRPKV